MFVNQNQEKYSLQQLFRKLSDHVGDVEYTGLSGAEKAFWVSRLYLTSESPLLVVLPSSKAAEGFLEDLFFFGESLSTPVLYFPPYNILPFQAIAYHNETAAKRIGVLYQLVSDTTPSIVVTTVGALLQKLIPRKEIIDFAELVVAGEEIDRDGLIQKLSAGGYVRSAIVEEPGDFAVRGGIMDIFSPLYPEPLRLEMFGDIVESLRFFSAVTQRKSKDLQEAVILPAREAVLKLSALDAIIARIRRRASHLNLPVTKVRELVARIKNEGVFPGAESLIPLIYPKLDSLFDYIPKGARIILDEPAELEALAEETRQRIWQNYQTARHDNRFCVEPDGLYLSWDAVNSCFAQFQTLSLKMLPLTGIPIGQSDGVYRINGSVQDNSALSQELRNHHDKDHLLLPLVNWIEDKLQRGLRVLLVCRTRSQAERLEALILPYAVRLKLISDFSKIFRSEAGIYICLGQITSGFVWAAESLAVVTEDEIFGTKHRVRRRSRESVRTELLVFEELKQGDLVVHSEHGIGRYEGLVKLSLDAATSDFLLILYKDGDKLYLPVDRMSMVQKYIGVDGITPILDKMGGKSWERIKAKVKRSVEKIAGELLKLYAARKVHAGHAFSPTDRYFRDFEAGFAYEETADQIKAIDDVLHDMEAPTPMDRLICGDVGYGKTEVALRASFKAINDGKQVAVLVPTTVLAEQHFATFSGRFEHYPVNVACLSRFRSPGEQRQIINNLKTGQIDIVIGTHRLLQKDVGFKDLGLVVLDEEQRFGVKHKEKLKNLRKTVDVLALTATPIPRTLHMSLMGVRDISIISTPPEQRHPIVTYISEFDDALVTEAIQRELDRNGQIFFVHNNIHSIWSVAKHLKKLVSEVRLDVAHGRLKEDELEHVMLRFMNKEIDLLVCTTIIESGLDVSSANTILINRADRFGLAQIYQLRGRVGRADEQAYAYLFIPNESTIGRDAQKRLKVLMEHSDLGSGFQIAMSDLKIRGGGTVLGVSQSGHIAAVGYDMFLKLMESAVADIKGEPVLEPLEPEINVSMSVFIPESFIPDIDQRLAAYRQLAGMTELKELSDFKKELMDRYGKLPAETTNLLLKIMLKVLAVQAGIKRLDLNGQRVSLYFSSMHQKKPFGIVDLIARQSKRFEFTPEQVLKVQLTQRSANGLLVEMKNILKEITQHVNA